MEVEPDPKHGLEGVVGVDLAFRARQPLELVERLALVVGDDSAEILESARGSGITAGRAQEGGEAALRRRELRGELAIEERADGWESER